MSGLSLATLVVVIVFGYSISGVIFFLYAYFYDVKNIRVQFYGFGKIVQLIPWVLYVFWGENLNGDKLSLTNSFVIIGAAIEVYSILILNRKKMLNIVYQLSAIAVLAIIAYFIFRNDAVMRVSVISLTLGILYSYIFFFLSLKKNTSKIQVILGWFAFSFGFINFIRGVYSLISNTEMTIHSQDFFNVFAGFSWIATAFGLPILFLFALLELENLKLTKYKAELESKVKLRTQELEVLLEKEKELGVLKTNFISMASHEFRTPLAAINATADVLDKYCDRLSKEDIHKRLNKIKTEIKDMTNMLEDVLTIGKSEAHKMEFHPIQLKLAEKINEIIANYQLGQDTPKPILFHKPESEIILNADPKWIKNIVTNLLSNAFKYSDSNVEINLTKEKDLVVLSVKDYGIGIPEKDLEHLFEPFHRGENVGNASGTGLGLTIIQKAVELHNGTIDVQSEVGVGTTFRISLPL